MILKNHKKAMRAFVLIIIIVFTIEIVPSCAFGETKPITDVQTKLEDLSKEEKKVLKKLFTLTEKVKQLKQEEANLNIEITTIQEQMKAMEVRIAEKQADYNKQLSILKKVLVNYQRVGPASYLEILLKADNFTKFLKSINLIKDISRNEDELLATLQKDKTELLIEKEKLSGKAVQYTEKKNKLKNTINQKLQYKKETENYLISLQEQSAYYREQLNNLNQMWEEAKTHFGSILGEIVRITEAGYLSIDKINISLGFTKVEGIIYDDSFNKALKQHSKLSETIISFHKGGMTVTVPQKHLVISGHFQVEGKTGVRFVPESGSFYGISLEKASLYELFEKQPLLVDMNKLAANITFFDFTIENISHQEGYISIKIKLL